MTDTTARRVTAIAVAFAFGALLSTVVLLAGPPVRRAVTGDDRMLRAPEAGRVAFEPRPALDWNVAQ